MLLNLAKVRHAMAGCESNAFTEGTLVKFVIKIVKKPRIAFTTYLSFARLNMSTKASNILTSKTKLSSQQFTRKAHHPVDHPK